LTLNALNDLNVGQGHWI